jgi:hypothetical protein
VHDEHNRPKKSGGFFLIIFGALLLIIAPTIYPQTASLGILAFIAGIIVGGLGFYLRFIKIQRRS